jgi:hypothetical protein
MGERVSEIGKKTKKVPYSTSLSEWPDFPIFIGINYLPTTFLKG